MLRTPASAKPLWIVSVLLGAAVYPLVLYSGHLYYSEGGRSPDGPGMLMVAVIYTTPVWLGIWIALAVPYLVHYPGKAAMIVGPGSSPLAFVLSIVAIAGSLGFIWLMLARVEFWRASRLPFTLHLAACSIHLQLLRAAAVQRSRC